MFFILFRCAERRRDVASPVDAPVERRWWRLLRPILFMPVSIIVGLMGAPFKFFVVVAFVSAASWLCVRRWFAGTFWQSGSSLNSSGAPSLLPRSADGF